jgi:hypothetical protein
MFNPHLIKNHDIFNHFKQSIHNYMIVNKIDIGQTTTIKIVITLIRSDLGRLFSFISDNTNITLYNISIVKN